MECEQPEEEKPQNPKHPPWDGGDLALLGTLQTASCSEDSDCLDRNQLMYREVGSEVEAPSLSSKHVEKGVAENVSKNSEVVGDVTSDFTNTFEESSVRSVEDLRLSESAEVEDVGNTFQKTLPSPEHNADNSNNNAKALENKDHIPNSISITNIDKGQCHESPLNFSSSRTHSESPNVENNNADNCVLICETDHVLSSDQNTSSSQFLSKETMVQACNLSDEEQEKLTSQPNVNHYLSANTSDSPQNQVNKEESYHLTHTPTHISDSSLKCPVDKHDKCLAEDVDMKGSSSSHQQKQSSIVVNWEANAGADASRVNSAENFECYESNDALLTQTIDNDTPDEDNGMCASMIDGESSYQHEEDPLPVYRHCTEDAMSSYKQRPNDGMETDIETDDDEAGRAFVSPSIYQSYEEGSLSSHFQTRERTELQAGYPTIAEYNTCAGESSIWSPALRASVNANTAEVSLSSANTSSYTSTQDTISEAATSSSQNETSTSSSSLSSASVLASSASSAQDTEQRSLSAESHEGALCTGDQNFKTDAERQSALVPFLQSTQSSPLVSSGFGANVVQGKLYVCFCFLIQLACIPH